MIESWTLIEDGRIIHSPNVFGIDTPNEKWIKI